MTMAGRSTIAATMLAALRSGANQGRRVCKTRCAQPRMVQSRFLSHTPARLHGNHDDDDDFVELNTAQQKKPAAVLHTAIDDDDDDVDDEDLADMVETVAMGPSGVEYGGPQRGGKFREPTRFGDWERKGRCSDF
ncbi:hypothetical protein P43SY_008277 [Pythium insidiosum]|uniref:Succinate dehydrogenase assembly factor 4, mitochondrial n=1 Tax=Pythium insidiosum TaxID=114742 RepID=A0AAD5LS27_PYTIN|nr:hypothetical protein P43SY_008277 [Pythium insidiosum]